MPRYKLEIREHDGRITEGEHETPEGEWLDTGAFIEHEGRELRVGPLEETDAPGFDQKLIVSPT